MDHVVPEVDRMARQLLEEIEGCHRHIMQLHDHATDSSSWEANYTCAKLIARLMQSQVNAMVGMKRLRSDSTQHTCTVVHQGDTPTPKKSKTNAPEISQQAG